MIFEKNTAVGYRKNFELKIYFHYFIIKTKDKFKNWMITSQIQKKSKSI